MKPRSYPVAVDSRTNAPCRLEAAIDFTMMEITHDAFRRDLGLLAEAVASGDATGFGRRWTVFKTQLLIHHGVEDANLWPVVRAATSHRDAATRLLDDMEREHAQLEPLLETVDRALATQTGRLDELVRELRSVLAAHLDHEERDALPLIQAVCTRADWRRFARHMRRRQGIRGVAIYVPWVLDRLDQGRRHRVLTAFPMPVRIVNRVVWERRYQQQTRSLPSRQKFPADPPVQLGGPCGP